MAAAWAYVTDSAAVKSGPGLLVAVCVAAGGAAIVTVYDGTDTDGSEMVSFALAAAGTETFCPSAPLAFSAGLYVDIVDGEPGVTVAYI